MYSNKFNEVCRKLRRDLEDLVSRTVENGDYLRAEARSEESSIPQLAPFRDHPPLNMVKMPTNDDIS